MFRMASPSAAEVFSSESIMQSSPLDEPHLQRAENKRSTDDTDVLTDARSGDNLEFDVRKPALQNLRLHSRKTDLPMDNK